MGGQKRKRKSNREGGSARDQSKIKSDLKISKEARKEGGGNQKTHTIGSIIKSREKQNGARNDQRSHYTNTTTCLNLL